MNAGTRIALVSDTHTWNRSEPLIGPSGSVLLLDNAETLHGTLLDDVAAAGVDLLVHLGDTTCGGGYFDMPAAGFASRLQSLRDDYRSIGLPVHALPGNHDCPPGEGGWSAFEQLWGLGPGTGTTIDLGAAELLLVNAQGHDAAQIEAARPGDPVYGWVSEAELARVDAVLAAASRPVVVALHQLLRPWAASQAFQDFYLVANAGAVLDVLGRYDSVRAVFQGHAHFYEMQPVRLGRRSVPFFVAPAVIEYPCAWLLLEAGPDALTVELRRLPLDEGARRTIARGHDQSWRAGQLAWQHLILAW